MNCAGITDLSYTDFSRTIHAAATQRRIPLNGTIELTQRCNLRCVHCYCCPDQAKIEITRSEACRILDELADAGCLWLLLTGGEPLLREDFIDIYNYAKKKGFLITVFSNATLVNERLAGFLREYPPMQMEVSVYGATAPTYEAVTGVPGSFSRCMHGIELLRRQRIPLKLKTTLLNLNAHELDQIKNLARNLALEFRFDSMLHPRLDGSTESLKVRLSPQQVIRLDAQDDAKKQQWQDFWRKFGNVDNSDKVFCCAAGKTGFHIDPYARLRVCDMVRMPAYDLRTMSFNQAWQAIEGMISRTGGSDPQCRDCKLFQLCDQCPGWAYLCHGDAVSRVEYLCRIAHERAAMLGVIAQTKEEGSYEQTKVVS